MEFPMRTVGGADDASAAPRPTLKKGAPLSALLIESRRAASLASEGKSDEAIHRAVFRALRDSRAGGDLLDFGAGVGNLLRSLPPDLPFRSLAGADLYPAPADVSAEWYVGDLNEPLPVPPESFDTLVSSEVIEHLENPRAVAREWFRMLRPWGTLVCSTPNNESLRSLLFLALRGHFVAFADSCYPAHITALVRKDLARILTETGFTDIRFSFTDDGGLPKMPRVRWQRFSKSLFRGVRFSDNVVVCARKPRR
jgi:2-polyprenyl-3-methyl-5-hydroxy-6-metoxy-1,4-benzoquinol methylase